MEGILRNLLGDLGRWLPNASGMALDYMPDRAVLLPQWGGGLVLAAYATMLAVLATATSVRRDVT